MEGVEAGSGDGMMRKGTFFPSNFTNPVQVLTNYYTQPVRIVPSTGQQTLGPQDELIITMPPASVIDLRTFQLFFRATTTDNVAATEPCGFPKHIASLIQTLSIYINGVCIQHIDDYNLLYNIYKDMYGSGEQEGKQAISTNADPSKRILMTDAGVMTRVNLTAGAEPVNEPVANTAQNTYCIKDWVGFLGSCRPSIIDTNLFGTFEVRIRLAPNAVLWKNVAAGVDPSYEISDLYAYVNRIDWKSPTYYSLYDALLSSGGSINMPYTNFRRHQSNALQNSKTNIMRFTESTQSLNKVIFTYRSEGANAYAPLQLGNTANTINAALAAAAAAAPTQAEFNALRTAVSNTLTENDQVGVNDATFETFLRKNIGPLYNSSQYFRRNGLGLGHQNGQYTGVAQLEVNSQLIPSYPLTLPQLYQETLKAFNLLNSDKGIHPAIKDINHYESDLFVGAFPLSHFNNSDPEYLISGFNSQASSIQLALHITNCRGANAAQSATCIAFTCMDAILKVGSGRQVLPIF